MSEQLYALCTVKVGTLEHEGSEWLTHSIVDVELIPNLGLDAVEFFTEYIEEVGFEGDEWDLVSGESYRCLLDLKYTSPGMVFNGNASEFDDELIVNCLRYEKEKRCES